MRALLYIVTVAVVMALAVWAYRENYRTQEAVDRQNAIQNEIAGLRENLGVLRAEWSYLNRPERLRDLVDLNFDKLKLVPVQSSQFAGTRNIDYPPPPAPEPAPGEAAASDVPRPADYPPLPPKERKP
ncbi:MAG: cell division protein FtsL [Paracoccus denitrificans]|nr:MAG: cell division protein FtsL [Paracoccus denitrificans]PZO85952.1 MAG: cell division protein FtsL [Paracoccus denitrificans]